MRVATMSKVEKLKIEIETLPKEEFAELIRWLSEKDWDTWDREIEADSQAGNLDFLVREAHDAKRKKLSRTCEAPHNRSIFTLDGTR
jgi:hypothetical protein